MSETTLKARLVHPCKTDAEWASSNPVAKKCEIMISSDKSGMFKVGNGTSKWSELGYNHVTWANVEGKPSTYPATAHTHDDRYYTESEIDGKLAKYLPKSGGTMEGTAFISWPDTGNWSNSNTGVTFPVSRGGLQWSGQSDGIQLYAVETGGDNLELYLKFLDDNSNGLSIRNAKGNETARISASGVISASSFIGTLTGDITGHAYGVRDYNNSKNIIQIGYSGDGLTTANLSHIAGYTDNGTKIKDVSKEVLRSWIGLGSAAYTNSDSYAPSSHTHDDRYYTETEINDKVTALNNSIATKVTEKTITTATDFNTFTTTGIYHICVSTNSNLHAPTTNHGTLIVDFSVGTPYQIWIPDNVVDAQYKRTYTKSSSTWSGWTTQKLTDTVYTHPSYTAYTSGLYKITTNSLGHVTSATAVTKGDITALGIPGSNTDSKVLQTAVKASDYTNWRTILCGASNSSTEGFTPTTVTDSVFSSQTLTFQPSTGTLKANTFKGNLSGNASTATALTSSAGSATQPVYFSGGKPVACTYTLGKSVPSNAVFTDTNTWRGIQNNLTSDSTSDSLSAAQGKVLKGLVDGKANTSHTHTKSQITDFPTSMPASDVYSWAKASSKPSYSWSEINSKPSTFTPSSHNHSSITRAEHLDTVDKLSAFIEANTFKYATIGELDGLDGLSKNDGIILSASWKDSTTYGHQIYIDDSGYTIAHRYRNQGSWSAWKTLIDSNNYTSYTVTKSGSGASGTWGISISGNAATATTANSAKSVAWGNVTGKPSTFTPSSHTHTKSQITDFPSSLKNPNSVIIKLNGGTTEGTNLFTYNGSSAKTINITAGSIGAASASHTHSKSQITDFPSSMPASDVYSWAKASSKPSYSWSEINSKPSTFTPSSHTHTKSQITDFPSTMANPHSITIKLNGGSTEGSNLFTYNGSSAKSLNITASSIGAASSSHTHSYLPLSGGTVTGNTTFNNGVTIKEAGVELYYTTPFIDFHYKNDSSVDYTSRIIENASGVLNVNGTCCTKGGSLWCTSFSTDGSGTFGGDLSAYRGLYLKHAKTSLYLYNDNGGFVIMHTGADGNSTWPVIWSFASSDLYFAGNLRVSGTGKFPNGIYGGSDSRFYVNSNGGCTASSFTTDGSGTFGGGVNARLESTFCSGSYTDPLPGVSCGIKVSGIASAHRFYVKGRSSTWLSGAQPGGAGFECVNDTIDNALIPGWRIRNYSGAWVGASYNMDKCFHLYYAKAERLSGNTNNGTDADFIFNANTGNFSAKSITQTSDERRKSVISSSILDTYKDFFMKIKPFSFKWKDGQDDGATHLGVGAQSVFHTALECGFEESDIGLVQRGKEYPGTSIPWSVSYTEFIPLNIAVTQDHETRIEKLEAHASKLERENEELKQQIKELKGLTA